MFIKTALSIFILFFGYFTLWPVPIDPAEWKAPKAPSFEGQFASNEKLRNVQTLLIENGEGPEDVAIDSKGSIFAGLKNGRIVKFEAFTSENYTEFCNTEGRPLGLHFASNGNLIVADSHKGLLSVDPMGKITVLTTSAEGIPFKFTDDVDVAKNGIIYFTDASSKFGQLEFKADALEHRPNGRLLSYNPATRVTKVLLEGLYFANGVAVSEDQTFVLVNETWNYSVRKYWIDGPQMGKNEILIENLPGFPDGISTGINGIFWLAVAAPRDGILDSLSERPFLRKMIMRLPSFLQPAGAPFAFILGIDKDGQIVQNLQDPKAENFSYITSVQEAFGYLYLGSYNGSLIGRYKL